MIALCMLLGIGTAPQAQNRKPAANSVAAVVRDTQGRPLAGARVRPDADFIYGRAEATTGRDGRYAIGDLLKANYRAVAHVDRDYAGGLVCQRLAMPNPADCNSFAASKGAERNFQ